jgi:hypothetical protein
VVTRSRRQRPSSCSSGMQEGRTTWQTPTATFSPAHSIFQPPPHTLLPSIHRRQHHAAFNSSSNSGHLRCRLSRSARTVPPRSASLAQRRHLLLELSTAAAAQPRLVVDAAALAQPTRRRLWPWVVCWKVRSHTHPLVVGQPLALVPTTVFLSLLDSMRTPHQDPAHPTKISLTHPSLHAHQTLISVKCAHTHTHTHITRTPTTVILHHSPPPTHHRHRLRQPRCEGSSQ